VAGRLQLTSAGDAILQSVHSRLAMFRGEWFLDESEGIPYFEDVLVKTPNLLAIREIFRRTLDETPGVLEVVSLDLVRTGARDFRLTFVVSTDVGELSSSTTVGV